MKLSVFTVCAMMAASTSMAATMAYFDFDDAYSDHYANSGWQSELWEHSGDLSVKITHDYGWVQTYKNSGLTAWHGNGDGSHQVDSYGPDDEVHFDFYYKGEKIEVDLHKITFNSYYSAGQWWDDFELEADGAHAMWGDASSLTVYENSDKKADNWSVRADGFHEFVYDNYYSSMDGWKPQYLCDKTAKIRDSSEDYLYYKRGRLRMHYGYDYQYKCASAFKITGLKVKYHEPTTEIPLPAAGWLLLGGIGGMAALRRAKKKS